MPRIAAGVAGKGERQRGTAKQGFHGVLPAGCAWTGMQDLQAGSRQAVARVVEAQSGDADILPPLQ